MVKCSSCTLQFSHSSSIVAILFSSNSFNTRKRFKSHSRLHILIRKSLRPIFLRTFGKIVFQHSFADIWIRVSTYGLQIHVDIKATARHANVCFETAKISKCHSLVAVLVIVRRRRRQKQKMKKSREKIIQNWIYFFNYALAGTGVWLCIFLRVSAKVSYSWVVGNRLIYLPKNRYF